MANQPTAPAPTSKPQRWEDLLAALQGELQRYAHDPRLDDVVERCPKDMRFEAEQLRASIGQVSYWLQELGGAK
jgi:hypothetical protein